VSSYIENYINGRNQPQRKPVFKVHTAHCFFLSVSDVPTALH